MKKKVIAFFVMCALVLNVSYLKSEEKEDKVDKIIKLNDLLNSGAITQAEYEQLKSEIVKTPSTEQVDERENIQKSDSINGYKFVDLGLPSGTLWASCNLGASKPEEVGGYYAWGELSEKEQYKWKNYKWSCFRDRWIMMKYSTQGVQGLVDYNTLQKEDDVVSVEMQMPWEIPSSADFKELRAFCQWDWYNSGGVAGYVVTAKNGNSIFIPAAGFLSGKGNKEYLKTHYWSSTLNDHNPEKAFTLYFTHRGARVSSRDRYLGLNIRPVVHKKK